MAKLAEPRHRWTEAENTIVRTRYPHERTDALAAELGVSPRSVQHRARRLGVRKSAAFISAMGREKERALGEKLARHRFQAGHVPVNKGRLLHEFASPEGIERMQRSQFKHGQMPPTHLPVGTYRQDSYGLWQVKVSDHHGTANRSHKNWRAVHRLVYEAEHGPIPEGHIVIFVDGNPDNCLDAGNLACLSRAALMRLNQSDFAELPNDRALRRAAIAETMLRTAAHAAAERLGLALHQRAQLIPSAGRGTIPAKP